MNDDAIIGLIIFVLAIHAILAALLANAKGYNTTRAFVLAFATGGIPLLIFYAGMPVTPEKQLANRRKILSLAKAHNRDFPEDSPNFINLNHV